MLSTPTKFLLTTLARPLIRHYFVPNQMAIGLENTVGADEIGYELHLGTNLDYIMHFIAKQLKHFEMTPLQSQCELERTKC